MFPPKDQQPGQPKVPDSEVDGYSRVVNGKVVRVAAYGKKPAAATSAQNLALKIPGRPRMAGKPGNYSGGRSVPGQKFVKHPEPPPQIPQMKGSPNGRPPRAPKQG